MSGCTCLVVVSLLPYLLQLYLMPASCIDLTAKHRMVVACLPCSSRDCHLVFACYLTRNFAQCPTLGSCFWCVFTTLCCTVGTVWLTGFAGPYVVQLAWYLMWQGFVQRNLGQGRCRRTSPITVGGRGGPSRPPRDQKCPRGGPSCGRT